MKTNLKFYQTNKEVTVNFREYGEITVPKGTRVSNMTACGPDDKYLFVCEYGWIKEKYPKIASILKWDAEHEGIRLKSDDVCDF